MKISVKNLCFGFTNELLFDRLSIEMEGGERPLVILGPSGTGKTTFLKLLAGLLIAKSGEICFTEETAAGGLAPTTSFMFQEPRLLPWLSVLDNVSLPLNKIYGKEEAQARARHFLSLVSLKEKESAFPMELSGGQAQRVSMARAFAWPAPVMLMDEPFQSLDIPLRIDLMDLSLSLLKKEKRLLMAVTHDPREAIYMGSRIIIFGKSSEGVVFDKYVDLGREERVYGSPAAGELEREMLHCLTNSLNKPVDLQRKALAF